MAEIQTVSPEDAARLLDEGYAYLDVRTEAEFEAGHVPGSYNVVFSRKGVPNPDFLRIVTAHFDKARTLIVGCHTGSRSKKAATLLAEAGYSNLRELGAGFAGARDAFGRALPGWSQKGLPVERGSPEGRSYADLAKARG